MCLETARWRDKLGRSIRRSKFFWLSNTHTQRPLRVCGQPKRWGEEGKYGNSWRVLGQSALLACCTPPVSMPGLRFEPDLDMPLVVSLLDPFAHVGRAMPFRVVSRCIDAMLLSHASPTLWSLCGLLVEPEEMVVRNLRLVSRQAGWEARRRPLAPTPEARA